MVRPLGHVWQREGYRDRDSEETLRRRRQEIVAEVTETATGATIERQWPGYSGAIKHIEARTAVGIETASSHIEECTSSNSSEKE